MRTINRTEVNSHGTFKRRACLALFWIFALLIPTCSMKLTGDSSKGFRGIPWGSHPESIKGLEIIQDQETLVIARRSNEKLRMGEARLAEIRYYFLNNSLFQVEVQAKGRKNLWHMREEIEKHYGPPTSARDQISHYFWRKGDLAVHLNYYSMGDRVIAMYSHVPAAGPQGTGKPPNL